MRSAKPIKRDAKGRVIAGSAPLNPTGNVDVRVRHQHYLQLMEEAVTDEDIKEIVKTAVEDAKLGNRFARDFIFEYLVGKPGTVPGGSPRHAPMLALIKAWMVNDLRGNQAADPLIAALIEGDDSVTD